jgi:metal-sulfur cluster biosynthetic enzyme
MVPGVLDVNVDLVWEPQWDRDMMTDEARLQMGML